MKAVYGVQCPFLDDGCTIGSRVGMVRTVEISGHGKGTWPAKDQRGRGSRPARVCSEIGGVGEQVAKLDMIEAACPPRHFLLVQTWEPMRDTSLLEMPLMAPSAATRSTLRVNTPRM
jgi:hypothetical protein